MTPGTGSESLKTVSSHGCAELPAQPLIDAHSCRFGMQGGRTCIGLASDQAAGQITRLLSKRHRFRSFSTRYARLERDASAAIIRFKLIALAAVSQGASSASIVGSRDRRDAKIFPCKGEQN